MKKLIEDWERAAKKYHKLGMATDHDPVKQEGLLCRSEVYNYCASKLRASEPSVEAEAQLWPGNSNCCVCGGVMVCPSCGG